MFDNSVNLLSRQETPCQEGQDEAQRGGLCGGTVDTGDIAPCEYIEGNPTKASQASIPD